ncbi:RAP protein, putative [Babesia caballi]|uniref:RAP protein, putative n=1 Tax=Babesia caballi TaxID=5871 RepID=A0AAV4LU40_BABCB|nr:RAP protein, putative [Babesia caballi]
MRVPGVARLRALLREDSAKCDIAALALLFREHHSQLSPAESVRAAAAFRDLFERRGGAPSLPFGPAEVQAALSSNIRGKLYALTEPGELCSVTVGALAQGIATGGLISDFVGRLERLLPLVRRDHISQVCHTLVSLHSAGHRVAPICLKLFAHLASLGPESDPTLANYDAIVRCMAETGVRHDALVARVGRGLRSALSRATRISPGEAASLLECYKPDMFDSVFIRHRLIEVAVAADEVPMEVVALCLSTGIFPSKSIEKINALILAGCKTADAATRLRILCGYADLRYRPPEVFSELLEALKATLSELNTFTSVAQCIHSLYLLDVEDSSVIQYVSDFVNRHKVPFSPQDFQNVCCTLQAFCYFALSEPDAYHWLIREAMRLDCSVTATDLTRLQVAALNLWKMVPGAFEALDASLQGYIVEVANRATQVPLVTRDSELQESVTKTATFVSYTLYKQVASARVVHQPVQVQVGPFFVDFVRRLGDEEIGELRLRDTRRPRTREMGEEHLLADQLRHCATILLAEDRDQFYRGSRDRTAESKMSTALLRALGFRVCRHAGQPRRRPPPVRIRSRPGTRPPRRPPRPHHRRLCPGAEWPCRPPQAPQSSGDATPGQTSGSWGARAAGRREECRCRGDEPATSCPRTPDDKPRAAAEDSTGRRPHDAWAERPCECTTQSTCWTQSRRQASPPRSRGRRAQR